MGIIFQDSFNRTTNPGDGLGPDYTWSSFDSNAPNQASSATYISPSAIHIPFTQYDSYNLNYSVPASGYVQIDMYIPPLVNQVSGFPWFGFYVPLFGTTGISANIRTASAGNGNFSIFTTGGVNDLDVTLDEATWYTFKFAWLEDGSNTITVWKQSLSEPNTPTTTDDGTAAYDLGVGTTILLDFAEPAWNDDALYTNLILFTDFPAGSGNSNALIDSPHKQQYGQATADIFAITYGFGQSLALIPNWFSAQAQADIKKVIRGFGQAKADVKATINKFGQTQAKLRAFDVSRSGQAQADINTSSFGSGQAQGSIYNPYRWGQSQGQIRSRYESIIRANSPLAYWRLGDSGSPLVDEIAGLNATVTGSPNYLSPSALIYDQTNKSVEWFFPGSGQFAQPSANTFTFNNTLTIAVWVYPKTSGSRMTIYGCNNAAGQPQLEIGASREVSAIVNGTFMATSSTGVVTTNAWNHIVYTRNGSGATHAIYVNGVAQTLTANVSTGYTDASSTKIIAARASGSQLYVGYMDELSIHNVCMSASDVKTLYEAGIDAYPSGQSMADIKTINPNPAQAQARIISFDVPQFGQALAYIGHFQSGQANALLDSQVKNAYGQAQAQVNQSKKVGQAQATIIVPQNEYENTIFSQVPIGYWPLDESSGNTFANRTGNGDGTLLDAGTITYSINHPLANAVGNTGIQFSSGSLSRISASVSGVPTATGSATTVTAWVKFASGQNQMIFGWFVYDTYYQSGNLGFNTGGGDVYGHSEPNSVWLHVASVYYDNQPYTTANKIYVNGVLQSLTQISGSPTNRDVDSPLYFSGWGANGSEWARGTVMDAVSLFPRELTSVEILAQYNAGIPRAYGQAQAFIQVGKFGWGQAQGHINLVGYMSGQAQAKMNAFGVNTFGQAQADILVSGNNKFGQSNAVIKAQDGIVKIHLNSSGDNDGTYSDQRGPQQPNYDSTNASFNSEGLAFTAAFNADETGTWSFRVSVDDGADFWISGTRIIDAGFLTRFAGEAQFDGTVSLTAGQTYTFLARFYQGGGPFAFRAYYKRPSDSVWYFLTDNNPPWIQIWANAGFGQANARIVSIVRAYGQAQTFVGHFQPGQAQADILATNNSFGQAQGKVSPGYGAGFGQAQGRIASIYKQGQAQADILAANQAYGQVLAFIGHFKWGQAQAEIKVPFTGQAQADIKAVNRGYGLALGAIDHGGHGQANADITRPNWGSGQAYAYILPPTFWGQAQARLIAFDVNRFGQANADIHVLYSRVANAQAFILKSAGYGQANCYIKQINSMRGNAMAYVGHFGRGQAQAFIKKGAFGQAQADIKTKYQQYAQTQAQIYHKRGYANVNADIIVINYAFGQTQALINIHFRFAQAQADISATYTQSGQANADIKAKYNASGQALAMNAVRYYQSAQARALITNLVSRVGQAQAYIDHFKIGQAQARMLAFGVPRVGQAQAYIIANINVTPPGPTSDAQTYLVMFDGQKLPGYAQSESFESGLRIETNQSTYIYKTVSETQGLNNMNVDLDLKVWEATYQLCKEKVQQAAVILRGARNRFAKLYIGHNDKYYLAQAETIKMEKDVKDGARTIDYFVGFKIKPWLIDNTVKTLIGTGTIDTDQVGRTIQDGGWTPTIMTMTGTDITISGYTADAFAGYIQISGSVTNLVIDTEAFTAFEGTTSKSDIIQPLDGAIYVGPGKTTFEITGATDFTLEYQDRWYL